MTKLLLHITVLVVIALATTSCTNTGIEDVSSIEDEILQAMEERRIPSITSCVVSRNGIIWERSFGEADIQTATPATRETLYTLMSISKLFIATAVMQLWEDGQIDLDEDINTYLTENVRNPRYPDAPITVDMLMNHTSGLAWPDPTEGIPNFYHFYPFEDVPLISEWLPQYIFPGGAQYVSNVWRDFSPGTMEHYSNIGTSLLARIVESVSGTDYRDYCRNNILLPLDMTASGFRLQYLDADKMATPYTSSNHAIPPYSYRLYPAGNLNTNLEDFSHFAMAILKKGIYNGNRILRESTMEKMLEVRNPASGVARLWWHCSGNCIGHAGEGTGFSSIAEWYPDSGKALFIFANKSDKSVYGRGEIYELVRSIAGQQ